MGRYCGAKLSKEIALRWWVFDMGVSYLVVLVSAAGLALWMPRTLGTFAFSKGVV